MCDCHPLVIAGVSTGNLDCALDSRFRAIDSTACPTRFARDRDRRGIVPLRGGVALGAEIAATAASELTQTPHCAAGAWARVMAATMTVKLSKNKYLAEWTCHAQHTVRC
jgi:hypothetical protein